MDILLNTWWGLPLLGILVAVLFLAVTVIAAVYKSGVGLGSPDAALELLDSDELAEHAGRIAQHDEWAGANGFQWCAAWRFSAPDNPRAIVFGWEHPHQPTFMVLFITMKTVNTDFQTEYTDGHALTTSTASAGMAAPMPPGRPAQAFPDEPLDGLWSRHRAGDAFVRQQLGWRPSTHDKPLEALLMDDIRGQNAFHRSHFLWPVRAIWWMLTARLRRNIPVDRQKWVHAAQGWR